MTTETYAQKAERLSSKRARILPFLTIIFLSQQGAYLSNSASSSAQTVKISAWLVLSVVLIAAMATKGFWLQPKAVRDLIDDENTRANRNEAMRWGFLFSMGRDRNLFPHHVRQCEGARVDPHHHDGGHRRGPDPLGLSGAARAPRCLSASPTG